MNKVKSLLTLFNTLFKLFQKFATTSIQLRKILLAHLLKLGISLDYSVRMTILISFCYSGGEKYTMEILSNTLNLDFPIVTLRCKDDGYVCVCVYLIARADDGCVCVGT